MSRFFIYTNRFEHFLTFGAKFKRALEIRLFLLLNNEGIHKVVEELNCGYFPDDTAWSKSIRYNLGTLVMSGFPFSSLKNLNIKLPSWWV